jgi:hypothetical protein
MRSCGRLRRSSLRWQKSRLLKCPQIRSNNQSDRLERVRSRIPMELQRHLRSAFVLLFILAAFSQAITAPFDLPGPLFEVKVTRRSKTLPISEVATLQSGDRIWVHPALPTEQSVHYLLIAVFLRGATNPPPETWFIKAETWSNRVREEGIVLTVPPGAQQAILFLARSDNVSRSPIRHDSDAMCLPP